MIPSQFLRYYFAALGALALLLVIEWLPAGAIGPLAPPRVPHVPHAAQGLGAKDTANWAQAINGRPLFTVSRRPAKASAAMRIGGGTGLPRLAGIMITRAGRRAIFMPEGGKPITLAEGALLDDNTIRQIRADSVLLTGPKGDIVVRPTYDKQRQAGFTPPTPNFPQPGFAPGFPNPAVPNPGFNPAFNPQPFNPAANPAANSAGSADDSADNPAPPPQAPMMPVPFPGFRGPLPHGRE